MWHNKLPLALCVFAAHLSGLEKAAYDSLGRIIALLSEGPDLPVTTGLVAVLPSGKRVSLQVRTPERPLRREPEKLAWSGSFQLPDEGQGSFQLRSEEDAEGLTYSVSLTAATRLEIAAIEWVLDLPRAVFLNGRLLPQGQSEQPMPATKPPDPVFFRSRVAGLRLENAGRDRILDISLPEPRPLALVDRWDTRGRSYQLRIALAQGSLEQGATASLVIHLRLGGEPAPAAPVRLVLQREKPRYRFDGFGGNYCWNNQSPIAQYTFEHLKVAWARTEMKLLQWDRERENPGPALRADFQMMQRFHKLGIPYVISIWWLPERFYTDPYEKPRRAHFRRIDPEKWPELLDLVGSYLVYARREYGVEPDLFSFNEANIGVYVGFDPEEHAKAIKRFGAYFQKLGLKTKMLLGDATGPRDTHNYVLAAAADPEAMQYVGAVAFHSWGGASREHYEAWGDVAEWLQLPLLVTELGVDAAAYHTRAWESYHYGLREARMTQEIMLYARPQGTQYWQFTNDYSLVRLGPDGAIQPTARFWLMKHFTDLTPQKSEVLITSSDNEEVLFTAFRSAGRYALHILNLGARRRATLEGLPATEWRQVRSTEGAQYQASPGGRPVEGKMEVELPARSLVTLVGEAPTAPGS